MEYNQKTSFKKLDNNRLELSDGSLWEIADDSLIKAYGWMEGSPVIIKQRDDDYEYNYIITNIALKKSIFARRLP